MYHFTNTDNPIDFPKMARISKPNTAAPTKQLYLIEYDCAHWAGASDYVVVWAYSPSHAEVLAESHMEEHMRELYADEYNDDEEEGNFDDECAYMVQSVEEFGPEHEAWKWYQDPGQAEFYPVIGEPE